MATYNSSIRVDDIDNSATQYSLKIYVGGLTNVPSWYTGIYINNKTNGSQSSDLRNSGNYYDSNTGRNRTQSYTFSGLSSNTTYNFNCDVYTPNHYYSATVGYTTLSPPVPSKPSLSVYSTDNIKRVTILATVSSDTKYIYWDERWVSGVYNTYQSNNGGTYLYQTYDVPNYNTTYEWDVKAFNDSGESPWSNLLSWTSGAEPVPPSAVNLTLSNVDATSLKTNFTGGAGSNTIAIEVREGSSSGTLVHSKYDIGTSIGYYDVYNLKEYTSYHVKCYGKNSYGNGTADTKTTKTLDKTKPTVSITNQDGKGRVWFDFSGSDVNPTSGNPSGLYAYAVWISAKNSTSLPTRTDTIYDLNLSYYSFVSDTNGSSFEANATYTMGVRSIDTSGNMSNLATTSVTYTKVRPNNWTWDSSIVQNQTIAISAWEWVSLGKAINQFRTYKNLSVVTFTEPTKGQTITASIYNEYRNAISGMSPPTSPPSSKVAGNIIKATDFTALNASLNSIP